MKIYLARNAYTLFSEGQKAIPDLRTTYLKRVILLGSVLIFLLTGCQTNSTVTNTSIQNTPTTSPTARTVATSILTQEPALPIATSIAQPSMAFDPAYTENTPLKDTQQMLAILEELQQIEFRGLTEPGWYLRYDILKINSISEEEKSSFIVHVIDQHGNCQEQMVFSRKDGRVIPFLFMDADGNRGAFNEETGKVIDRDSIETAPAICNLQNSISLGTGSDYYFVSNYLNSYRYTLELLERNNNNGGEFSSWFEGEGDQEFFVVQFNSNGVSGGSAMDTESGQFQAITDLTRREVFDLSSGRPIRSEKELTLDNGKVIRSESQHILVYYPELPTDLQAAFDQVVAGLEALKK